MFADDLVDGPLVWGDRVDIRLLELGTSIARRRQEALARDAFAGIPLRTTRSYPENLLY